MDKMNDGFSSWANESETERDDGQNEKIKMQVRDVKLGNCVAHTALSLSP